MKRWSWAALVVGAVFYAAALSHDLYDLTSPPPLGWHVLLRKSYSLIAFGVLGYLIRRALAENGRARVALPTILIVTAYSALIEFGQRYLSGSREGLTWNAIDTLFGTLGGALAVADLMLRAPLERFRSRS